MDDAPARSPYVILAQFGAVCAVAGVVIGGCLGLFFGNDLAKGLMWFVIENMPLRKKLTVVRLHDPLLQILAQDPGMDAQTVMTKLFPNTQFTIDQVQGNRPVYSRPFGSMSVTLRDGSCVLMYDWVTSPRDGTAYRVIYRTATGWDQGYIMSGPGLQHVLKHPDCRAQLVEARTP